MAPVTWKLSDTWLFGSLKVKKAEGDKMRIAFTLPTYKTNRGDFSTIKRNAEITIRAECCDSVTVVAAGKEYHIRHDDFKKVAEFILEEFCE